LDGSHSRSTAKRVFGLSTKTRSADFILDVIVDGVQYDVESVWGHGMGFYFGNLFDNSYSEIIKYEQV
jgi:hypothetical protein